MTEAESLTITASDGHRFKAALYPAADPAAPVLIFLSALGTPSRVYGRFGREMSALGVQLVAPDWRGIDSSSVRAGRAHDFGYRHLVEIDLPAIIDAVGRVRPGAPLWLGGHSLGGQLCVLGAATHPDVIAGTVLIASGCVHLSCYSAGWRLAIRALALVSRLTGATLGYFPGNRFGFGGREASGLLRDWWHVARHGTYRPIGSEIDYEQALHRLTTPMLALNFSADSWAPAGIAALLAAMTPNSPVTLWEWDKSLTQGVMLDHFSWIKQPGLVAPAIAGHIRRQAGLQT